MTISTEIILINTFKEGTDRSSAVSMNNQEPSPIPDHPKVYQDKATTPWLKHRSSTNRNSSKSTETVKKWWIRTSIKTTIWLRMALGSTIRIPTWWVRDFWRTRATSAARICNRMISHRACRHWLLRRHRWIWNWRSNPWQHPSTIHSRCHRLEEEPVLLLKDPLQYRLDLLIRYRCSILIRQRGCSWWKDWVLKTRTWMRTRTTWFIKTSIGSSNKSKQLHQHSKLPT